MTNLSGSYEEMSVEEMRNEIIRLRRRGFISVLEYRFPVQMLVPIRRRRPS